MSITNIIKFLHIYKTKEKENLKDTKDHFNSLLNSFLSY